MAGETLNQDQSGGNEWEEAMKDLPPFEHPYMGKNEKNTMMPLEPQEEHFASKPIEITTPEGEKIEVTHEPVEITSTGPDGKEYKMWMLDRKEKRKNYFDGTKWRG